MNPPTRNATGATPEAATVGSTGTTGTNGGTSSTTGSTPRTDGGMLISDGGTPPGNTTIQESHTLRRGARLDVTDDAIEIHRDDETLRFAFENIVEVSHAAFDYFLGILSIALVGFGILSFQRNIPAAVAFTALGLASLYRTYNRRGQLKFRIQGHAKPVIVYPEHAEAVYEALEPYVATE